MLLKTLSANSGNVEPVVIDSGDGLLPVWHQAITRKKAELFVIFYVATIHGISTTFKFSIKKIVSDIFTNFVEGPMSKCHFLFPLPSGPYKPWPQISKNKAS